MFDVEVYFDVKADLLVEIYCLLNIGLFSPFLFFNNDYNYSNSNNINKNNNNNNNSNNINNNNNNLIPTTPNDL